MSMITASTWVSRGAAASFPTRYNVDEDELARISVLAKLKLEDAQEDLKAAEKGENDEDESDGSEMDEEGGIATGRSQR